MEQKQSGKHDMGPAEIRLRMLLANPPSRRHSLLDSGSVVAPILVLVGLLLYWNFILWPVLHKGQTFAGWLFEWATQ